MSTFTDVLMVIGLFALRFGVPLAIMVALAYGLKRLDRRWEAEARQQMAVARSVEQPAAQPLEQPAPVAPASFEQPTAGPTPEPEREVVVIKVNGNRRK